VDDEEVEALWHAGTLRLWVRALIAVAWMLTVAIVVVVGRLVWSNAHHIGHPEPFWYRNLAAVVVGMAFLCAVSAPARITRWIRVAVALPFAQAAGVLTSWLLWRSLDTSASEWWDPTPLAATLPLADAVPLGVVVLGLAIAYAAVAAAVARRHERLHAAVMLALANLLLVGLWSPIASRLGCSDGSASSNFTCVDDHLGLIGVALTAPPFLGAVGFTTLHFRRRRPQTGHGTFAILFALFVGALASSVARAHVHDYAVGQFMHVLLAVGLAAVGAMGVLAGAMIVDTVRARRRLATGMLGVVRCSDPEVAAVSIASWLRGPQQVVVPFAIATAHGEVPVPGGARWAGPLPAATTRLRRGEAVAVLRAGDVVSASGFVESTHTDPFRTARAWLPNGDVWVGRADEVAAPANVGLALWRPAVAFLAIVIAIGVPALVAAVSAL
jgi:hypothetical protein